MIEVEKKFILGKEQAEKLTAGARLMGAKTLTAVYYDTADHALTKKDLWLRHRTGRFELKIPLAPHAGRTIDQYEELQDEADIKRALGLPAGGPLMDRLAAAGYRSFATITTSRKEYQKDGFTIDIDSADYGYDLAEIELMVGTKEEIAAAAERIIAFATACGLGTERVRGKVIEFLARNDREHFAALEAAWGVKL